MSAITPIFPMPEPPQHFNDYGFDPQMDFFQQVLGEARRQKKMSRPIDSIHFKLHKPILDSKRYSPHKNKNKIYKKKWWKNAFTFFKWGRRNTDHRSTEATTTHRTSAISSCPLYLAESRSGSTTPYRTTTGPSSSVEITYVSLRDQLNMEAMPYQRMSTSTHLPIYLVT